MRSSKCRLGGVKPSEGVLLRPSQSIWSGLGRVFNSRLGLLARQTCGMSAPCCGIPCPFSVVLPVRSEGFLRGARGAVSCGDGTLADDGQPDLQSPSREPITSNPCLLSAAHAYNQRSRPQPHLTLTLFTPGTTREPT